MVRIGESTPSRLICCWSCSLVNFSGRCSYSSGHWLVLVLVYSHHQAQWSMSCSCSLPMILVLYSMIFYTINLVQRYELFFNRRKKYADSTTISGCKRWVIVVLSALFSLSVALFNIVSVYILYLFHLFWLTSLLSLQMPEYQCQEEILTLISLGKINPGLLF